MKHDVAVVGASIAGLYTGWKLAASGRSVCIVDRRKAIGVPVRCGEATGNRAELRRFIDIDESWIACDVAGLAAHVNDSPGVSRRVADAGVVLHRGRFEQALAAKAEQAGARVVLDTLVTGLAGDGGDRWTGVRLENGECIEAGLVVGADGPESSVGRWAGITVQLGLTDAFSAAQYRVRTDFCDDGCLHFFVGEQAIPGGYVWVFPKGNGEMSVGAGLYGPGTSGRTAKSYLDDFVKHHMPGAPVHRLITGCAPLVVCPRRLHKGNVVVVGDAARQVNPLTAGGIMNTLEAADLVVHCVLKGRRDDLAGSLGRYSSTWASTQRRQQKVFAVLKNVVLDCSDEDLVTLLRRAEGLLGGKTDRSKPFAWSMVDVMRMGVWLFGRAWRHWRVLMG